MATPEPRQLSRRSWPERIDVVYGRQGHHLVEVSWVGRRLTASSRSPRHRCSAGMIADPSAIMVGQSQCQRRQGPFARSTWEMLPNDIQPRSVVRVGMPREIRMVMSLYTTLMVGGIAGLTIFLGLPVGRLRRPAPNLRVILTATSIGVLVFLL